MFACGISAADYSPKKKKYSIISHNDEIFTQFDEYSQFRNITVTEPSEAIISEEYLSLSDSDISNPSSVQSIAGQEILNYLDGNLLKRKGYSPEKWRKKDTVTQDYGTGVKKEEPQQLPPGIMAKLPFESRLSLSGRKLIAFDLTSRVYDKEEDGKRKNTSNFKMDQELQMRIMGSVGDRLNINVDYDDTADKRDISLIYKGQPGEVIREAAFGDISVSLPTTEFVGYSKELFGLKVDAGYKRLGVNAFFSKTKGSSEMKRYTGNTQLERRTISDTSYIRLKYYSILKPSAGKTIMAGSAMVYMDYQRIDPRFNISISTDIVLGDINNTGNSYRGNFVLLVAGQDYTIDYNTGILSFKNTLANNYSVAVDYQFTDGSWLSDTSGGLPLVIKDANNTAGITTEVMTFYNLGNLKINRDNGRGNFVLEIQDLNGGIPADIDGRPVPKYPSDIIVDFENGVFRLANPLHADLYSLNGHKYNFITEYQYNAKVLTLRPGIVPQSEKVVVDGRTLTHNTDYIIDYDMGILTILKDDIVLETSVIDVSYDYSMFGTESESTLIGANSRLDLTDNISVGASVLYNSTAKGSALPDIRSTPESLLVTEVDAKILDLDIDALNMRINADAEYAVSSQDDNTAGKALVDSMDNSLQEDTVSLIDEFWVHSANAGKSIPSPDNVTGSVQTGRYLRDLSWRSREINIREIDPSLETVDGQKQLVLDVNYNLYSASELAFSNVLSLAGYDFSKKLYVDVWIKDNTGGADFAVDYLAAINEDADASGMLDTEDKQAKGFISPWEDTGQEFRDMGNPGGSPSLIGAHNGKLDTEDLNGNGILDTYEEFAGSFLVSSGMVIKESNGWKQIRIPADALTPSIIGGRKNVRYLRFRVIRGAGGQQAGSFSIGKIAIVGNRWEQVSAGDQDFSVSSIGKYDPDYETILGNSEYRTLYDITGSPRKDDQALNITYNIIGSRRPALARSVYTGDYLDISKYESIRFFVYARFANPGDVIVFRAGGNDDNYLEYSVPVTADASWKGWKLITIEQKGYGRGASWSSPDPSAVITSSGMPALDRVAQFTLGVLPEASSMSSGRVWFKEIHVSGSKTLDGSAWKAGGNLRWKGNGAIGAITAGVYRKAIDRDFQTITAGVYNRDYLEDSAYVDFEGLKTQTLTILPVKAGITKYKTVTPDVMDNNSNLISINEQGTVTTYTGYAETNLNLGVDLPQIGAQYSRSIIDSSEIKRLEDRETLSGSLVYNNPVLFPLLPTNVTANARTVNSYFKVYPDKPIADSESFLGLDSIQDYLSSGDYHTLEQTKMLSVKLPFKFSKGIIFSPAYVIDNINEKNKDFPTEVSYDKSRNQSVGASLVLGIVNWFSPTFTYNINTRENYDIYSSTGTGNPSDQVILPGQNKYIERNGVGEISWNLNAFDITKSKFLKSLTFSAYYRLQDSDSYENVDKNFDSMGFAADKLWIRDNMLMEMQPSYSTNSYTVKTVMNRNDVRVIGRYMPFEAFGFKGRMSPLGSLSANFTYTEGSEGSYITGTSKDVYTKIFPELLLGISGIEKFFWGEKWVSDSQINFKYFDKNITTYGISYIDNYMHGFDYRFKVLKKLDLYFAMESTDSSESDYVLLGSLSSGFTRKWVGQGGYDYGRWRFSLRYESEEQWQKNGLGNYSSQVLRNSYLGQINADLTFPAGIKIPFFNTVIPLKNRLILLSNIKYITQESAINVETDNNVNYGFSADADYEVSKYLRLLIGCAWSKFEYTYNADLNYSDISLISKLTIQF
jgi:hypothetical protein